MDDYIGHDSVSSQVPGTNSGGAKMRVWGRDERIIESLERILERSFDWVVDSKESRGVWKKTRNNSPIETEVGSDGKMFIQHTNNIKHL